MPKDRDLVVKGGTVLAFDFGFRKIGVAVGNTLTKTTMPLDIIYTKNGGTPWSDIENLLEEWKPLSVIVGDPINMDDTFSEMSGKARKFAQRLHGRFSVKVLMVDERLSSFEAKSFLQNEFEGKTSLDNIDSFAAEIVLKSWMKETT
tara:strand:+ start:50 stop:490 length:441 start_codon:yes stop_codon:yes gene_type:complete